MSAAARRSSVVQLDGFDPARAPRGLYSSRRASLPPSSAFERGVRGTPPWACADGQPGTLVVSFPPEYDRDPQEQLVGSSGSAPVPGSAPPRGKGSRPPSSRPHRSSQPGEPIPRSSSAGKRRSKALSARGVPPAGLVRMLEGEGDAHTLPEKHLPGDRGVDTDDDTTITETNSSPASTDMSPPEAPTMSAPPTISVTENDLLSRDEFSRRLSMFGGN